MLTINSELEKRLLTYYFINTEAKHYLQELARILKTDPANLDKKLKKLEKIGLFQSNFQGKQKYYYLNQNFSLFTEYKSIINKTYGIENILRKALEKINNIKYAYLFGSYLKNSFDAYSDLDLLLVGSFDSLDVARILKQIEKEVNRDINVTEMNIDEFKQKKKKRNPFLKHIFNNNPINLIQ